MMSDTLIVRFSVWASVFNIIYSYMHFGSFRLGTGFNTVDIYIYIRNWKAFTTYMAKTLTAGARRLSFVHFEKIDTNLRG